MSTSMLRGAANAAMTMAPSTQMWRTARHGTERLGDALPDVSGLHAVKRFIDRHPIVATCAVLAVSYYFLGGARMVGGLARLAR